VDSAIKSRNDGCPAPPQAGWSVMPECRRHAGLDPASIGGGLRQWIPRSSRGMTVVPPPSKPGGASCRTAAVMPECRRHAGLDPASIGYGLRHWIPRSSRGMTVVPHPRKPGGASCRTVAVMPDRCRHAGLDPASIGHWTPAQSPGQAGGQGPPE
jgi:hypothetical protein